MKILIIGGTKFVGRHISEAVLKAGHELTIFHRGKTNPDLFEKAEELTGDRDGNLEALIGKKWDVVIDTCGYFPRVVRQSAELLKDAVSRYVFISTISVYDDLSETGITEDSKLAELKGDVEEEVTGETYGPFKVECEKVVQEVYGDRALIIRPGLIVGPHDHSDRFTYWVMRTNREGTIVTPKGDWNVQFIDVRDLAEWTVKMSQDEKSGVYNATGPDFDLTFRALLDRCQKVLGKNPEIIEVDHEFLSQYDVKPWSDIPLWMPGDEASGVFEVNILKAMEEGLVFRRLEETIKDTYVWALERPDDYEMKAGLKPDKEKLIAEDWQKQ